LQGTAESGKSAVFIRVWWLFVFAWSSKEKHGNPKPTDTKTDTTGKYVATNASGLREAMGVRTDALLQTCRSAR
jgi:hypothetical protein